MYDRGPYGGYLMQQNPYVQRYEQMQMRQPQQQPYDALVRVTGLEGAKAYQMPANSSVALFDANNDLFYVKSTDGAGFPTIQAYKFTPVDLTASQSKEVAVTREEFDNLNQAFQDFKEVVLNGKQPVRKQSKAADAE